MTAGDPDRAVARRVRAAGGTLLLVLVALTPWLFGCFTPTWRLVFFLGVFSLLATWAAHAVLARRIAYTPDAVSACLLGLVLLTAAQLVPLPEPVARVLSPAAAEWHRTLIPEVPELLPGEAEADAPRRSRWVRLSVAPAATENMLAQFLAAFLVYAAVRNFAAAEPGLLRRLAWVSFAAGVGLATLGLAQYLSGERSRIYWRVEVGGVAFGPFASKNHFAFQVNLFMGLAGGLFVAVAGRRGGWRSPAGLGLLGGLGLMAAAVAFSQSRGGLLAALAAAVFVGIVAWLGRRSGKASGTRAGLVLAAGVAVVAGGLTAWFGWRGVADRLATLWDGDSDIRSVNWRSVWPLVERFPLVGVGGGGLVWAEPAIRTRPDLGYEFNTLDNEYLEALVEGGGVRLALTLGLAVTAVWGAVAGYRRTGDPLLLGCTFGLAAVAFQSAGDFGLHAPSVALAAATVAALSGVGSRGSVRGSGVRGQEPAKATQPVSSLTPDPRPPTPGLTPDPRLLIPAIVLGGLVVVLVEWRAQRVWALRNAATARTDPEEAIRYLEAAARVRPNDPRVWHDLMFAHLSAATEPLQVAATAVAGPAALALPPELPADGSDPGGHVAAALRAARLGRACQPLDPAFHLVLGTFTDRFARSEPPTAHTDRAKRVAAFDFDVWYASGRAAARRGDWPAALADWRESIARSPKRLGVIIRRAGTRFPPNELRTRLLPDDPAAWRAALPLVFPHPDDPGRRDWLRATADRWASGPEPATLAGFSGWAATLAELGDTAALERVWRLAAERFPDDSLPRDRLAELLEAEERYEEAIPLLEALIARHPDRDAYRERLAAARHALKLRADINAP